MWKKLVILILIFIIGVAFGRNLLNQNTKSQSKTTESQSPQQAFISEVFDKIKENYWDNISDSQLLDFFKTAIDKNGGQILVVKFDNKNSLLQALPQATNGMDEQKKNQFFAQVAGTVLASLTPLGRSGLYTTKQEEQLKNTVQNINPQKDLYKDLGVSKGASEGAVQQAYQQKADELSKEQTDQAKEQLKELAYAKDVLTQKDTKDRYDQNKVEPTIFTKIISPDILYMQFKKFSPTSFDEFTKAFDSYKDNNLNDLILDLRGNIGGAIDSTPYFLGLFIGKGQYAFDFYHKGEYIPFKTPTDKLPSLSKYKQMVILVDNQTQSSAEMLTASLKKYHLGVAIGTPTKGWGTVERVFPIDNQFDKANKYSLFLVHSITLRDDNQPIEGRGVDPDINIKNTDWTKQLYEYFHNSSLVDAVTSILNQQ